MRTCIEPRHVEVYMDHCTQMVGKNAPKGGLDEFFSLISGKHGWYSEIIEGYIANNKAPRPMNTMHREVKHLCGLRYPIYILTSKYFTSEKEGPQSYPELCFLLPKDRRRTAPGADFRRLRVLRDLWNSEMDKKWTSIMRGATEYGSHGN